MSRPVTLRSLQAVLSASATLQSKSPDRFSDPLQVARGGVGEARVRPGLPGNCEDALRPQPTLRLWENMVDLGFGHGWAADLVQATWPLAASVSPPEVVMQKLDERQRGSVAGTVQGALRDPAGIG